MYIENVVFKTFIMNYLEEKIEMYYNESWVDASLPATGLYLDRGYIVKENHKIRVENERVLVYFVMQKQLKRNKKEC